MKNNTVFTDCLRTCVLYVKKLIGTVIFKFQFHCGISFNIGHVLCQQNIHIWLNICIICGIYICNGCVKRYLVFFNIFIFPRCAIVFFLILILMAVRSWLKPYIPFFIGVTSCLWGVAILVYHQIYDWYMYIILRSVF